MLNRDLGLCQYLVHHIACAPRYQRKVDDTGGAVEPAVMSDGFKADQGFRIGNRLDEGLDTLCECRILLFQYLKHHGRLVVLDERIILRADSLREAFDGVVVRDHRVLVKFDDRTALVTNRRHRPDCVNIGFCVRYSKFPTAFHLERIHVRPLGSHRFSYHLFYDLLHMNRLSWQVIISSINHLDPKLFRY